MYDPTTTEASTTGTSGCYPNFNNCIHRLPCGLCTYLRTICNLCWLKWLREEVKE